MAASTWRQMAISSRIALSTDISSGPSQYGAAVKLFTMRAGQSRDATMKLYGSKPGRADAPIAHSRCEESDCGRFRQGRGRQDHGFGEPGRGVREART